MDELDVDSRYACCFCGKGIADDQAALVLTGMNFRDWKDDVPEPRSQSFWTHFVCLQGVWQGSYPWEGDGLFEE